MCLFFDLGNLTNSSDVRLLYPTSSAGERRKRQSDENATYVPVFFEELNFTDEQRMICDNNPQCLFDLAVTDDTEIALNTLEIERDVNTTRENFGEYRLCNGFRQQTMCA